jgi:aminoglycoside phosphotransferase (APT) family kinase protein
LNVAELTRWLNAHVDGGVETEVSARLIAGGRSNPTFELTDGNRQWILRRPPYGHVLPSAHDMSREHRVVSALQGTPVPVPRVIGLCADATVIGAQFYVMDKLDGRTLRTQTDTAALTPQQRRALAEAMVDALVAIHEVKPETVGLSDWGHPSGYLERQLGRWQKQWAASETTPRSAVDELLKRLRAALPESHLPGIVHGDFKIDNMMVANDDPARIIGVLDWEMSTLGDTLTDVGILCSFWDQEGEVYNPITAGATAVPGFGTREEVVQRYASSRGVEIEGLDWYMVFADFKLAVILEGIHVRHAQGQTVGSGFETIGEMVDPLLERALNTASGSSNPALRG